MTARITAASVPIKFNDGVEYLYSPLTDKDIDEMDEWLQARSIENARNSLAPGLSAEERQETLSIAIRDSLGITMLSGIGAKMVATVAGMTRLVWQGVKKNHPDVTIEQLRSHLLHPENIREANRVFESTNAVPEGKLKNGQRTKLAKKRKHR